MDSSRQFKASTFQSTLDCSRSLDHFIISAWS
ncbi:uncharacterized protein HMPREF1541_00031 [Cyphellophora europaea CBS 101466]|uniref:Uncharacterized protein n=1 Tax=Cyphellophora europaea (strain CBS 101466) TaxID=1220924 RepID=W2SB53_CYPE1|nr:uncharacterized protein HMPREF1541_00031 [Cyphellophora europaea CBS 101466]ETN45850.1 hypothetical protein HMPREF1541_00031 [Cyphellophora europaea CBS 101466]